MGGFDVTLSAVYKNRYINVSVVSSIVSFVLLLAIFVWEVGRQ